MLKKDEYILECEQHLQTMKENIALHETLSNQKSDAPGIDTATLEEEWMRRLTETREMYEQAIHGYKEQLGELQGKLLNSEQVHATQVQKLKERLAIAQTELRSEKMNEGNINGPPGVVKVYDDQERHSYGGENISETEVADWSRSEGTGKQGHEKSVGISSSEERECHKETAGSKEVDGEDPNKSFNNKEAENFKGGENVNKTEEPNQTQSNTKLNKEDGDTISGRPLVIAGDESYSKTLEYLVKRLENLCLGGDEVDTTLSVITDTINRCLWEWRESFQQDQAQQKGDADQPKKDYEELQRKLRGKNKKIESLQKQCNDLEQQNMKLLHRCSQLGSQVSDIPNFLYFRCLLEKIYVDLFKTEW